MKSGIVFHIPHASLLIPDDYRTGIIFNNAELDEQNKRNADLFSGELYATDIGTTVSSGYSRFVCDMERFRDDAMEVNAGKGNGLFYTHTLGGVPLRDPNPAMRQRVLDEIYDPHHARLTDAVDDALAKYGQCLIIDGHTFSEEFSKGGNYPDFCIGTSTYHTPQPLIDCAAEVIRAYGFTVQVNHPFSGTMVTMKHYKKDSRVLSLMIEVNKRIYLKENMTEKSDGFTNAKQVCQTIINKLKEEFA
ncbi:MAG: N-formylglutamate amidohydrolase [Defluviitaleaceae bacterium]|nr:N-formylglutamate amidohydrolase [Defluviitaleaceae bacterium]